jgi:CheY-like chemotaxis protein
MEPLPEIPAPPPTAASAAAPGEKRWRILLVEDHGDTAIILARILRKMGHEVAHAATVASALEVAKEQVAGGGLDLLISDVGLPDGNGLDLMRELSARYSIRGIALSGFGMDSDIRQSIAAGFSRHLTKPIDITLLRKTLAEIMAKP